MKIETVTNVTRAVWERPVLARLDAADARNTAGSGGNDSFAKFGGPIS